MLSSVAFGFPAVAAANPKSVPTQVVTPQSAGTARSQILEGASSLSADRAARILRDRGAEMSDPILLLEAADAYLRSATEQQLVEEAQAAINTAEVAQDLLYFLGSDQASPDWQPVDASQRAAALTRSDEIIARAHQIERDIEDERNRPPPVQVQAQRKQAPGTAMIASGSALLVLGVAGTALGTAGVVLGNGYQKDVEAVGVPGPEASELDRKGASANTMAIAGFAVGGVGLIAGTALLVVGSQKRKKAQATSSASLMVVPAIGAGSQGLVLTGRF